MKIPGPTAYDIRENLINKRPFTLKGRTNIKAKEELSLGPGQYPIKSLFGKDNCLFLSNNKFLGATKINPASSSQSRIILKRKNLKEPDIQYDQKYQIQPNGKYFNSKFKSIACPKIIRSLRKQSENKNNNIGPGEYVLPSDFGIYKSSLFVDN